MLETFEHHAFERHPQNISIMPKIMFEKYVALCTTDIYLMPFLCLQKKKPP